MGYNGWPVYGNVDLGSAVEDVKNVIAKIESNKFDHSDILKLYNANAGLLKAVLNNEYKDEE